MVADPHFAARESVVTVETARHGPLKMQNAFPRLSRTPGGIARPAPATVGQDTADELARVGYGADEIAALKRRGIV